MALQTRARLRAGAGVRDEDRGWWCWIWDGGLGDWEGGGVVGAVGERAGTAARGTARRKARVAEGRGGTWWKRNRGLQAGK